MEHVVEIAKAPHFTGSDNHHVVSKYIEGELQKLGIQTQIQEGTTLSDWGNLVKSRNIIGRINGSGNGKSLLLLSHYDSAPHSYSPGAADDASGVAAILEGIRAFLESNHTHKNDIIILFTDAEELGLNGAALFVTKSKLTNDIGVALNFEARGTSGPSYMLMEVNDGNAAMVNAFAEADCRYPVSNSLMYSIYKMLPNDTDLTVFRENSKIQGFNFAFIDGHFNYHTAQDNISNLDQTSVSHQGTYLMPLLNHLSNADLSALNSLEDEVYFNTPFGFFHYPFLLNFPLAAIGVGVFFFLVIIGIAKRLLEPRKIGMGFILMFGALLLAATLAFFGWKVVQEIYPEYHEILQGFPYNGHAYIGAFTFLVLSIAFIMYSGAKRELSFINYSVAPIFIWLVINILIAVFLPGAGFFMIPVLFSLLMFGWFIITQRAAPFINLLLAIPTMIIFVPLILMLPVGLGLKIIFGSAVLTVMVFGLMLPIFGCWHAKRIWAAGLLAVSAGFFIYAQLNSGFAPGKAKPNSLVYFYDVDTDKALWATYDTYLDKWTRTYLNDQSKPATAITDYPMFSKYNSRVTHTANAPVKDFLHSEVTFLRDSVGGTQRFITIKITPKRKIHRFDIFAN
ncbi:MAG: M20/M25/M40 family metallo-hydrolase, partial [Flavisolibacter sp.]|nr:M20/M25/M40 family metallo-hydrolase [Flavisolibacter sp.]